MSRVALALTFALTACGGSAATPHESEFSCNLPTTNEWLKREPVDWTELVRIDPSHIRQISNELPSAIRLLEHDSAVQVSAEQVTMFTGVPVSNGPAGTTAYLVRAVFPTARPVISVGWYQADLMVVANGLGCAPYEKHPIIVYLDRRPANVFVGASAAL